MPLLHGKKPLLVIAFLLLSACRDSVPPKIEICIGDGVGGADCVEADGSKKYLSPSELKNYWMSNQPDMANFTSWCYQTTTGVVNYEMASIYRSAHR